MGGKHKTETPEQQQFRAHCRDWLAAHKPGEPPSTLPQTAMEVTKPEQLQ